MPTYHSDIDYRADVLSADVLFVLNHHARHLTPMQRIDLSNALAALVGCLGDNPSQRIGSLVAEAPVEPQRGRAAYKPKPVAESTQHTFTVPNDAPKHIALIAN